MFKGRIEGLFELFRFHEYGPFFVAAGLMGCLSTRRIDLRMGALLLFIAVSSMSGFVLNDLCDVEEDKLKKECRNPISAGKIGFRESSIVFIALTLLSIALLCTLTKGPSILGLITLINFWLYSWGLRLKTKPFLDLIVHGAWPALYATMGYLLYLPLDLGILSLSLILFLLSMVSQILQELRDMETDNSSNTVKILKQRNSIKLTILLMLISITLYVSTSIMGFIPFIYIFLTPLFYLLAEPLTKTLSQKIDPPEAIAKLRIRGLILAALMVVLYVSYEYL